MIEPDLVLGGLETLLNRPPDAGHSNQVVIGRSRWGAT
jgi:hypothetical protein